MKGPLHTARSNLAHYKHSPWAMLAPSTHRLGYVNSPIPNICLAKVYEDFAFDLNNSDTPQAPEGSIKYAMKANSLWNIHRS